MKTWFDLELTGKPWWKIVLRGAALPGLIVAAISLCAIIMSVIETGDPIYYLRAGIFFGLFITLFGGIEMMISLLLQSREFRINGLLALGYAITWAFSLIIIFKILS